MNEIFTTDRPDNSHAGEQPSLTISQDGSAPIPLSLDDAYVNPSSVMPLHPDTQTIDLEIDVSPYVQWSTRFVIENKLELTPPNTYPPFSVGGKILLYAKDEWEPDTPVPKAYVITNVMFDVYSCVQYVHLKEQE